jgi:zinc/manganese transport system substrate-binding protein
MRHHTHPRTPRYRRTLGALLAAGLLLSACSGQDGGTSADASGAQQDEPPVVIEPVLVVATTSILGDIVANLVGSSGSVNVLMAPGVDPHGYQASAADAAAMRDADLVVANGLLLEEGLIVALESAVSDGVRVFTVADKLDPIEFGGGHDDHDDEKHDDHDDHDDEKHDDHDDHDDEKHDEHDDHGHGDEDPHFWWDPIRTALAVELIAAELAAARPDIDWAERAERYSTQILALHEEIAAMYAAIPDERRRVIADHDSLGYLQARYGLEVIGTIIPGSSTNVAVDSRSFAALIELMIAEDVAVILVDSADSGMLADQLATEVIRRGGTVITVAPIPGDSLGTAESGADTYLGMLRAAAVSITSALAA